MYGAYFKRNVARLALVLLLAAGAVQPAYSSGPTWLVDRAGDNVADGDLAARRGTLRFALAHAASGDLVTFGEIGADFLWIGSTLEVPPGVAVGLKREQSDCGDYAAPLVNIRDNPPFSLAPLIRLGAGAALRGVNLGGGDVAIRIAGAQAEVCGVGVGFVVDGDGARIALPPKHAALVVDGPGALVRRSYLGGAVSVTPNGSDTRIGDALGGSGDANAGIRAAAITVLADDQRAAQRVTMRDPMPRALHGIVRPGVFGGDDAPNHANNWAQTPTIDSARSPDGAAVEVSGTANPHSLVDIFLDNQLAIVRGAPVSADAQGHFSYSGPLPAGAVQVYAVSTLNDPAFPQRIGSSSEWAGPRQVIVAGAEPLLAALGGVENLSSLTQTAARPGDILRFTVAMTNVGAVPVTNIFSTAFQAAPSVTILLHSGKMQGQGSGFSAGDDGFRNGTLAPGQAAAYSVDALVNATTMPGLALMSLEVNAAGVITIPVVARMRITPGPAPGLLPRAWVPLVQHS